jgi:hypothetical protein
VALIFQANLLVVVQEGEKDTQDEGTTFVHVEMHSSQPVVQISAEVAWHRPFNNCVANEAGAKNLDLLKALTIFVEDLYREADEKFITAVKEGVKTDNGNPFTSH